MSNKSVSELLESALFAMTNTKPAHKKIRTGVSPTPIQISAGENTDGFAEKAARANQAITAARFSSLEGNKGRAKRAQLS